MVFTGSYRGLQRCLWVYRAYRGLQGLGMRVLSFDEVSAGSVPLAWV